MTKYKDIFEYITIEENAYSSLPISVIEGWEWKMKEHIRLSVLYKNSQFSMGNSESERDHKPFKNIVRPILNVQYRAEDIDVKDIQLYVDDSQKYHLSFLVKKYHDDVFILKYNLDEYIDELKESKIDFGGGLSKKMANQVKPEVVPLQSIAFCDQTDILGGPIGFKHFFSPDQLRAMSEKGWGEEKNGATITIDDLILLSETNKIPDKNTGRTNETPGNYIEIYEVHGIVPLENLEDNEKYQKFLWIAGFYIDSESARQGVLLFQGKEKEGSFKFIPRDKIYGRALGMGGIEELFDSQVWTNWDEIRLKGMLDQAAKVLYKTTDANFANRNETTDLENGEILVLEEGKDISQIDTVSRSIGLFERQIREWQDHAQTLGAATDPLLGKTPPSGTPFRLQERVVFEGKGIHDYRRGQFAKHLEEIYRDWIIPYIAKEITKNQKFLSELSTDEMQFVSERVVENEANKKVKEKILNGELVFQEEMEEFKVKAKEDFLKGGNKRFLEILEGELKDAPLKIKINISGKQKDLADRVDKVVNIFRFIIANPAGFQQVMQVPGMERAFNEILEFSGFSPVHFAQAAGITEPVKTTEPLQELVKGVKAGVPAREPAFV